MGVSTHEIWSLTGSAPAVLDPIEVLKAGLSYMGREIDR